MVQCYYSKETIDRVAKAWRHRLIFWGSWWCGIPVLLLIREFFRNPNCHAMTLLTGGCLWVGMWFFFHLLLLNAEKTTLKHAGDIVTLDDDEIRLIRVDGTQIALPRKGLRIQGGYYAAGNVTYTIGNPEISREKIVLTNNMENVKELVETIRPGAWDAGSE